MTKQAEASRGRGRPVKPPGTRRVMRSFRLDPRIDELLTELARSRGEDRTASLEAAIRALANA
jgi:hypothetical protein